MDKLLKRIISVCMTLLLVVMLASCADEPVSDDESWNSEAASASDYDSSKAVRSTQMSIDDSGKLVISRNKRDSEIPMGADGTWSIFVYLCGTDLETNDGSASDDINEMIDADVSANINIIVQTGGAKSWDSRKVSPKKLQRFKVTGDGMELLCEGKNQSMGSSDTLYNFLSWGVENYPAEHMAVILWNHGSGSINGVCFDERYDYDSLYLSEIEEAFARVYDEMTCRFEFVGFDACLMATIETANVLVPHAKYMIGSQELESGYGWDYEAFLEYIDDNPDCTGAEAGKIISKSYFAHCKYTYEDDESTMSVINLENVDAFLMAFNEIASELYAQSEQLSGLSQICRAISGAENFGGNNQSEGYTNMVDLGDMLKNLSGTVEGCDNALSLLKQMIVYMVNGESCSDATGLSIYYPLNVQGSDELNIFRNICISPYYMNLVERVAYGSSAGGLSGYEGNDWSENDGYYEDNYGFNDYFNDDSDDGYYDGWDDWFNLDENDGWYNTENDLIKFSVEPYVNSDCYYTMIIAEESLDYVASISFALLKDSGGDDLIYLGNDNAVSYDLETGEVMDCFTGEWPMLPDGQTVAIYLVEEGDSYNIYSIPVLLNDKEMSIRVRMDYDDWNVFGEFSVIGVWEGISENGQAGRKSGEIKEGDVICPIYETSDYYTGEEGVIYGDEYRAGADFNISVGTLPDADYYYSYEILDIFGNSVFTEATVFSVEDGELYGYPDENADEYDSYFSDGFFDDFGISHDNMFDGSGENDSEGSGYPDDNGLSDWDSGWGEW